MYIRCVLALRRVWEIPRDVVISSFITTLLGSVLGNLAFLSRESPSRESTNTLTGIPYNA